MSSRCHKRFKTNDITFATYQSGNTTRLGFVLKKKPSITEAMCLLSIMGIDNYNCKRWFDNDTDFTEYLEQCRSAVIDFLKGKVDFDFLCNETMCYAEYKPIDLTRFIVMIEYLHSRGII